MIFNVLSGHENHVISSDAVQGTRTKLGMFTQNIIKISVYNLSFQTLKTVMRHITPDTLPPDILPPVLKFETVNLNNLQEINGGQSVVPCDSLLPFYLSTPNNLEAYGVSAKPVTKPKAPYSRSPGSTPSDLQYKREDETRGSRT